MRPNHAKIAAVAADVADLVADGVAVVTVVIAAAVAATAGAAAVIASPAGNLFSMTLGLRGERFCAAELESYQFLITDADSELD
jgi:hypothetical protein